MFSLSKVFAPLVFLSGFASEVFADQTDLQTVNDAHLSAQVNQCASGLQDVQKVYYMLVDQSASIDAQEWDLMMQGIKNGLMSPAIMSEYDLGTL